MKRINIFLCAISVVCGFSACSDFFDQTSEQVIFTEKEHLNTATDTVYSVTGIINKLQAIADRTILLGEVRADLVDITNVTNSDLRDVALFNVGDENRYNQPRDYYAIINNCNYFVAHADTALKNNRNEYIFMKEYAAVKAIRAWTYLQLVINYGSVPFVIDPVLTKQDAEKNYQFYSIEDVCRYFIDDLLPLAERYKREYPVYGSISSIDSQLLYFPINIVLGDLYLWLGSITHSEAAFRQSALRYYKYISERNGDNSYYPLGLNMITWKAGTNDWEKGNIDQTVGNLIDFYSEQNEKSGEQQELITMIPGDELRSDKNYSQLRNLFYSNEDNDYHVSLVPSTGLNEISDSQVHCCLSRDARAVYYAEKSLDDYRTGDLRLWKVLEAEKGDQYHIDASTNERIKEQHIKKFESKNVHIYRRTQIYLRLAEALNGAGFPRMAFGILSTGLNEAVMEESVYPYILEESDSIWASQIDFPRSRYDLYQETDFVYHTSGSYVNTMGIHTRGSGWTPLNEFYKLPEAEQPEVDEEDPYAERIIVKDTKELTQEQQAFVDSLILNENALEMCFEGTRFYDLMRYAYRQDNPGKAMAKYVYARRGEKNRVTMMGEIKKNLEDQRNWFLNWNGKIGL